jgi:hypothetical protein
MYEAWFSTNDKLCINQEARHVMFQDSFVILPHRFMWKYVGSKQTITTNTDTDVDGESLLM